MSFINFPSKLHEEQYAWLKKYAHKMGESMATIIRTALREFKRNHDDG
jgi:hypothetical protein